MAATTLNELTPLIRVYTMLKIARGGLSCSKLTFDIGTQFITGSLIKYAVQLPLHESFILMSELQTFFFFVTEASGK
jgi:hypothetical protein